SREGDRQLHPLELPSATAFGRHIPVVNECQRPCMPRRWLHRRKQLMPDALPRAITLPRIEASPAGRGTPIGTWHLVPPTAGAQDIEDAVENPALIGMRAPTPVPCG